MLAHFGPNWGGGTSWCTSATFHEADIEVDLILGYPWLEKTKLGVFPHLEALAHMGGGVDTIQFLGSWREAP